VSAGTGRAAGTVIVDYQSGNLHSAEKSFARMAAEVGAGPVVVSADPEAVLAADRVVLPGVGAFADCRAGLMAVPGLFEAIETRVIRQGAPFLGICVGCQMMASVGRERGETPGLRLDPRRGRAPRAARPGAQDPPHGLERAAAPGRAPGARGHRRGRPRLLRALLPRRAGAAPHLLATVCHGEPVTAVIGRDNLVGTQFHPEKSQATGLRLIANFLRWRP
jgi:imidazole glycerol-phosphate synthase subunit HisH